MASEDTPASLAEAEKLLNQHQSIREEIDNYTDDYIKMMEYGERITAVSNLYLLFLVKNCTQYFLFGHIAESDGGKSCPENM